MVNQYFKNCKMCGKKFVTFNPRVKKCDECKSEDTITHKSDKQKAESKQSRKHNLNRTLYNLHKYNEENGTRLSYGQYRAKIETGEIAI